MRSFLKKFSPYSIAVGLSTFSLSLGMIREFLIVFLLGLSSENDRLQIYLSIFYTTGLSLDAIRLSCLNLCKMPLPRLLLSASIITLPFALLIGFILNYSTGGLNLFTLGMAILGSYLNLLVALLITYKQRFNNFLKAQMINVLPNYILIPGILLCFLLPQSHIIQFIVFLMMIVPILQFICLLCISHEQTTEIENISILKSLPVYFRHFSALMGDQMFQIIIRIAFFRYGSGYLSIFSLLIKLYSAARFILVDSFIGSKLSHWQKEFPKIDVFLNKMIHTDSISGGIIMIALFFCFSHANQLLFTSIQIILTLIMGFYFSTLLRIIYFKINRHGVNQRIIFNYASLELIFAGFAFILSKQLNYPIMALLWLGYILKPFIQILLLRSRFNALLVPG